MWQATGPALALMLSLAFGRDRQVAAAVAILGLSGVRLALAAGLGGGGGVIVGQLVILLPEWAELVFGIPAILGAFGAVLWFKGFGPEDRELFKMRKRDRGTVAARSRTRPAATRPLI
jgi:hypothetical protein